MSNFFVNEEAYREMQEERQPRVYGWSSCFNTYADYCAYSGLDTPEQEDANRQYEYEQWLENMTPEEKLAHEAYVEQERERIRLIEELNRNPQPFGEAYAELDEHPF